MEKILIIGGGISGLTAGIYAQKAGFETLILEKHNIVGGECTGWNKNGYHVDGCIHYVIGSKDKEGNCLNKLWKEIGAFKDVPVIHPDYYSCTVCEEKTVFLYNDKEKMEQHLIDISPEDKDEIIALLNYSMAYKDFEPPYEKPFDLMSLVDKINYFKGMSQIGPIQREFSKITVKEYLTRFKSVEIRSAFSALLPDYMRTSDFFFSLGAYISSNAGRPAGGSLAFSNRILQTYLDLGGKVKLNSDVENIIIEKRKAKGICLKNGENYFADYIIAACDVQVTLKRLLKDKYKDKKYELRYNAPQIYPLLSCVYLSFIVDAALTTYPHTVIFKTKPLNFEDKEVSELGITNYSDEPSFASEGKTVLTSYIQAQYEWWEQKSKNKEEYLQEKNRLAERIINRIEIHYPELKGKIKMLDVATPLTYERFCGAFHGSYMSFGNTPKSKMFSTNGLVKGIKNLFLAGQWTMPPGGLPNAALTGKWAVDRILKKRKRSFFDFIFK